MGYNTWRNELLWKEYELGRIVPIRRGTGRRSSGRKGKRALQQKDDVQMLSRAVRDGAFVCSNDLFREHRGLSAGFPRWRSRYVFQYEFTCRSRLSGQSKLLTGKGDLDSPPAGHDGMEGREQECRRLLAKLALSPPPKVHFKPIPSPTMAEVVHK
mmetsp:Transcript_13052/g.47669  ORF Transcript_13052/g.47669 Transcript_13052/m.47669 type:complete len:156 (-) Transcript_13052:302-769(-)